MRRGERKKADLRVPREGTVLRRCYDALLSGDMVNMYELCGKKRIISKKYAEQLRDFYFCELVGTPGHHGGTRMVGRWDGPYFVPVERLERY